MTPDREEALRLAREIVEAFEHATEHGRAADVHKWRLAELSLALAADLEAAERERDACRNDLEEVTRAWEARTRDLATAREALEDIGNMRFSDTRADMRACQDIARAALRSLDGEEA